MRLVAVALLVSGAAAAQVPAAELSGNAVEVEFAVRGAPQKSLRVPKGGAMTLKLAGPVKLGLELRVEALVPRAVDYAVEVDGKRATVPGLNTAVDPALRSDKGQALSRPTSIELPIAADKHVVTLRWPADAPGEALVAVSGVAVTPALPELALPLPVPLPLPAPAAAEPALAPLTGASAPPPASSVAVVAPEPPPRAKIITAVPVTAAGPSMSRFGLDLRATALRSSESYTDAAALGGLGARFAFRIKPLWIVALDEDLAFSHQNYQAQQLAAGGQGLARASLDEQRIDSVLTTGWDLGPWLRKDGRLVALPYLGLQDTAIRNGAFPLDLFGIAAGARARWELSPSFAIKGGVRWTYNLLKGSTLSAVGTPVSDLLIEGGLSLPLAGNYAVDLGYRGDLLALKYDTRVAHGMSLAVESVF